MSHRDVERRMQTQRKRRRSTTRARLLAGGALAAVAAMIVVIIVSTTGGGGSGTKATHTSASTSATAAAKPGTTAVPILTYHVINSVPAGSGASPDLYTPQGDFSAQMQALKTAGWRAVTLDQVQQYWTKGTPLPAGKPIVVSFDGGYASQYTNALPVLKALGWVGVINLPSNGRAPTDGGIADDQTRGLIAAGWELDAGGNDSPDLTALGPTEVVQAVKTERQTLQVRYKAPVNWYSYAAGRYNPTVTAALSEAGFTGGTTLVSGWADPQENRFRLPRLQVPGGTSATALLAKITAAQSDPPPPPASTGV